MATCKCGCGESVNVADFLPGHDQRLRSQLEHQVGGLLVLKELVLAAKKYASGETGAEEFENTVRHIFAAKDQR